MSRFERRKRIAAMGAAAVLFAAWAAGCQKTASMLTKESTAGESMLKLGGIAPLSGAAGEYGNSVRMGALLAVEEINASGGINGYPVSLIFLDDAHDEKQARQAYQSLKEQGMQILLGTVTSEPCQAVSALAAKDGMFQMIPSAVDEACIQGERTFRLCFSDGERGRKAAEFFSGRKADSKAAVVCDGGDEHFRAISRRFCERAAELGLEIADERVLETEWKPEEICRAFLEEGVDQIFMAVYYSDAERLLKAMESIGYRPELLSCEEVDTLLTDTEFDWEVAGDMLFQEPYPFFSQEERNLDFREHYLERYDSGPPDQYAAEGYDAVYAVKEAAKRAAVTPDMPYTEIGSRMQNAMEGLVLDGVMGRTAWDASGEPQREMPVVRIEGGEPVEARNGERKERGTEETGSGRSERIFAG